MLVAVTGQERVGAEVARRGDDHRCPGCGGTVALKRGAVVTAHFAHARGAECAWGAGETELHRSAKRALTDALRARGVAAEPEVEVLSHDGDRRADVLVHAPGGARIALEIQHSPLAPDAIAARTRAYAAAGVAVLWVGTIARDLAQAAIPVAGTVLRHVAAFAGPGWWRWAMAYHGHVWLWDGAALWRGWLGDAWVASRAPAEDGMAWRPARRADGLTLEGPFAPGDVRLRCGRRGVEAHETYALPAGPTVTMLAPGERTAPLAPVRVGWYDDHGHNVPRLEVRRAAGWAWAFPARPRVAAPRRTPHRRPVAPHRLAA